MQLPVRLYFGVMRVRKILVPRDHQCYMCALNAETES